MAAIGDKAVGVAHGPGVETGGSQLRVLGSLGSFARREKRALLCGEGGVCVCVKVKVNVVVELGLRVRGRWVGGRREGS